ncbi:hypothetical protein N7495_008892 [Penicillium taxi]|uniref:uncharacterized protein n=1 Tax=Penicillium taxi TaxID=168475 RepID=UPI0025459A63|nr:uncharacterized protein N7495_008892 [Penicillium taxi]KAJ5888851.1 hypothetical protein N7495_008892 [Penicillium taxi]
MDTLYGMEMETSSPRNLPSIGSFVDSLITELISFQSDNVAQTENQQNPLSGLSTSQLAKVKPIMLTLHCIFPNDFLPAMDILDRKLVQRMVRSDRAPISHNINTEQKCSNGIPEDIIFVRSASATAAPTQEPDKGYEVRLQAWNCTCPTFALSAFRDLVRLEMNYSPETMSYGQDEPGLYPFGGSLTCTTDKRVPPACKHILACVLFVRCPGLFGGGGDGIRHVSMEELAGWCAGWAG